MRVPSVHPCSHCEALAHVWIADDLKSKAHTCNRVRTADWYCVNHMRRVQCQGHRVSISGPIWLTRCVMGQTFVILRILLTQYKITRFQTKYPTPLLQHAQCPADHMGSGLKGPWAYLPKDLCVEWLAQWVTDDQWINQDRSFLHNRCLHSFGHGAPASSSADCKM